MIISHGLIALPCSETKYYRDLLGVVNGWIPLFNNKVPTDTLSYVISEDRKTLTTCILELDISSITGSVKIIKDGQLITFELDGRLLSDDTQMIFIRAPLPLSCLKGVLFQDKEDVEDFEIRVKALSNVVLENIKLRSTKADQKKFSLERNKEIFDGFVQEHSWLPVDMPSCSTIDYPKVYAYGGMLSVLFYYAKNGPLSNFHYQNICDAYKSNIDEEVGSGAALISDYFVNKAETDQEKNSKKKIYHRVIKTAIEGTEKTFKNDLLNILDNSDWDKEKEKTRAAFLAKILRDYEFNTANEPVSQQFKVAKTELGKMLLILFVREDSDSLAKYTTVSFSEEEYIVFAMIFGIRDKFNKLPTWLKKYRGLQDFISTKMAEYAHFLLEDDIKFNKSDSPPTVWELIEKKVSKKTIKVLGIEHCIKTIMPKFTFSVSDKDGKVTYPSFIEPTYKVENDKYFNEISSRLVTDEIYKKLLNK